MPPRRTKLVKKNARISMTKRAGIVFPVSRIRRNQRAAGPHAKRVAVTGSVFLAAVLEYLVSEILDMAADIAHRNQKKRVIPRHVQLAVRSDEDMAVLMANVTIPEGGVRPWIHAVLLPKTKKPSTPADGYRQ